MKASMKVVSEVGWCTKYALTRGIIKVRGERVEHYGRVYLSTGHYGTLVVGAEVFWEFDSANENAKTRAARQIALLEKKIAKMRELAKTPMVVPPRLGVGS